MSFNREKTNELRVLIKRLMEEPDWDENQVNNIIDLINEGADYTIKTDDSFKNSILLLAILRKSSKLVKFILEKDSEKQLINYQDAGPDAKNTSLLLAIKTGNYSLAIDLLDKGADPDICCAQDDMTALHYATGLLGISYKERNSYEHWPPDIHEENELAQLIKALISKCKNPDAKNSLGTPPTDLLRYKFTHLDQVIYKKNIPSPSFSQLFGFTESKDAWKIVLEIYELMEEIESLEFYNESGENNEKISKLKDHIKELKNSGGQNIEEYVQTYWEYRVFCSNCSFAKDQGNIEMLETYKKSANPKILEFYNNEQARFQTPCYSAKQILEKAQNKEEGFAHLNSLEAINTEIQEENGIIKRLTGKIASSKAAGINDFYTIISGVAWHRIKPGFNLETALLENRAKFLDSKCGRKILNEIETTFNSSLSLNPLSYYLTSPLFNLR